MRRGLALAALVGGFVAATTLPAGAQYIGWNDWGGGVGVSVGFGAPGFYAGYAAYPSYYAAAPSYYTTAPSYYATGPEVYAYSGPSYGTYGYVGAPAYGYSSTTVYEPGYAYGGSRYVGGYREGIRSRGYVAGGYREGIRSRAYAAGGYREGIRSRSRSARAEFGDRTGSNIRSTSAARPRSNARSGALRGDETTGRGGGAGTTSTRAGGGASMQPSGMNGASGQMGGQAGGQMGSQSGAARR